MKKLNFIVLGTLLAISLTTRALAETTISWTKEGCESVKGTWITAHSATDSGCDASHCNGKNFCKSSVKLNWWSAHIWCQSIGHKQVDFATLCPGIPTEINQTEAACANISGQGSGDAWISMIWGNEALVIKLPSGKVGQNRREWGAITNPTSALCME